MVVAFVDAFVGTEGFDALGEGGWYSHSGAWSSVNPQGDPFVSFGCNFQKDFAKNF